MDNNKTQTEENELKRTIISDEEDYNYPYDGEGYTPVLRKFFYRRNIIFDVFYIAASLLIAMVIALIVFQIGTRGVKDSDLVDKEYDKLIASSSKYNELLKNTDTIHTEIDNLTHERDQRQIEYDALIDYSSKSAEIQEQINALQSELDAANQDNSEKQAELNALTGNISSKISSIVNLAPGTYTVGDNIAAGKYSATGSGSVMISTASGSLKLNTVLTADGTEVTLDDGDRIHLDTRAKFSPI